MIHAEHGIRTNGDDASILRDDVHLAICPGSDGLLFVYLLADSDCDLYTRLPGYTGASRKVIDSTKQRGRISDTTD